MDEYGQFQPARHLRAVEPDDMYTDDMPMDLGACERLEREARRRDSLLEPLYALVGGADALDALDTDPIPDEAFDWSVVAEFDRAFVASVLELTDRYCNDVLDVEFRTITRRLIALVAQRGPGALRLSPDPGRVAAAFVWLAGRANGEFGRRSMRSATRLWARFGVGNASDRGRALRRAAGLQVEQTSDRTWGDELAVGDASLLHSSVRASLIARRNALLAIDRVGRRWHPRADGKVEVRARPAAVITAGMGAVSDTASPMMLLGLGDDLDDADFFALTIPEAKSLVARVQHALDGLKLSG
jgi:hypothetical protein